MEDSNLSAPLTSTEVSPSGEATATDATHPSPIMPVDNIEISKFFGYTPGETIDHSAQEYMKTIWDFYAPQAKTPGEVMRLISNAEREVAPPLPGEDRLGKFYTYVRLLEQEKSVQGEISAYKK